MEVTFHIVSSGFCVLVIPTNDINKETNQKKNLKKISFSKGNNATSIFFVSWLLIFSSHAFNHMNVRNNV